jgi:heme A synthase
MITAAHRRFANFAWGVLAYNILVILWGAYVRVSFSGDGCGAHWPFCNGQVIPQNMGAPMAIEFTHRMMTSIDSVAVIAMSVWAFRTFPRRHVVRLYSVLSLVFLLIEALLGAGLVLLRYVARDQSAGRAWYLSAHLTNTMLLLAVLTVTAWAAYRNTDRLQITNASRTTIGALPIVVFVSITGASFVAFCWYATRFLEHVKFIVAAEDVSSRGGGAWSSVSDMGGGHGIEAWRSWACTHSCG